MECRVKGCKYIQDTSMVSVEVTRHNMNIHMQEHIVDLLQKLLVINGGKPY